MSFRPTELIKAQTGAVTTPAVFPVVQKALPATVSASNLAGSESVAILFSVDGGSTFEPMSQGGAALELTATDNQLTIESPLMLGVTKSATAGLSGVFIMTTNPLGRLLAITETLYVLPDYVADDYVI